MPDNRTDDEPVLLPPDPPGGFTTEERELWKRLARPDHTAADAVLLEQVVAWHLLSRRLLEQAKNGPTSMAAVNAAVTSGTMLLRLSEKLGLSAADRKALGVAAAKAAPRPRRRTSLDDLTPEQIFKDDPVRLAEIRAYRASRESRESGGGRRESPPGEEITPPPPPSVIQNPIVDPKRKKGGDK